MWEQVWAKDSFMDIIGKFLHLSVEEFELNGVKKKKETIIFPRFHQMQVVRKVTTDARQSGAGKNYLIQHSAGSGKSNSIAWLSYRLSSLHDEANNRIFDSVIVITDRKVLDSQLQNTIYQFEHKDGVVQKIDKDSTQLANAISAGSNIIITTLQKFPFILDKIGEIPARKYAVIIDEAHSSQGGEATKKMKEVLSAKSLEEAEKDEAYSGLEEDAEDDDGDALWRMREHSSLHPASFALASPDYRRVALREVLSRLVDRGLVDKSTYASWRVAALTARAVNQDFELLALLAPALGFTMMPSRRLALPAAASNFPCATALCCHSQANLTLNFNLVAISYTSALAATLSFLQSQQ